MSDICYYCDGTGERDFLSGARCHECNGTGWKDDDEPEDENRCYWCDGQGCEELDGVTITCDHCNGTGNLESTAARKETE